MRIFCDIPLTPCFIETLGMVFAFMRVFGETGNFLTLKLKGETVGMQFTVDAVFNLNASLLRVRLEIFLSLPKIPSSWHPMLDVLSNHFFPSHRV